MIKLPTTSPYGGYNIRPCNAVYADNAATTQMRPSALSKYISVCTSAYGNPSSLHRDGRASHETLEWARGVHARHMNVNPDTIYFTSSGTESNNIAIRGVLTNARKTSGRTMIVTSAVEHSSVRRTAELAAGEGNFLMARVMADGHVDEAHFRDVLQTNANHIALVSIILAQNEVGTLQRIPTLVKIAKSIVGPNLVFHTDATQAFGKYYINPELLGVDILTASAHKYHGPRGVGILYARHGILDPNMLPITGGGQERGCRSGTENVPAIAAAAEALDCMIGNPNVWRDRKYRVMGMRNAILEGIVTKIPGSIVNGDVENGLYNLASVTLPSVDGVNIAKFLDDNGVSIGSGSACSKGKPSETLLAMGRTPEQIRGVVRISLSEFNTPEDCRIIVHTMIRAYLAELASKHGKQTPTLTK
jgi:cysteine desulfurase